MIPNSASVSGKQLLPIYRWWNQYIQNCEALIL
jgi:hypothetical protein